MGSKLLVDVFNFAWFPVPVPVLQKIPRKLEEVLGPDGTDQFVDFLNTALQSSKEDVIQSVADKFERRVVEESASIRLEMQKQFAEMQKQFVDVHRQFAEVQKQFAEVQKSITGVHAAIATQTRWLLILALGALALYPLITRLIERLIP